MFHLLTRRHFFQVSALTSLTLLSQAFISPSSAIADTSSTDAPLIETYHVYIPYQLARYGGQKTVLLKSGESYTVKVPSRLRDKYEITVSGKGINNDPISIIFYTLYSVSSSIGGKIKEEIDKCSWLQKETTQKCKLTYEQLEDGELVDLQDLSLLDYIVSTSSLDKEVIERYTIASSDNKISRIADAFLRALDKSNLTTDNKKALIATAQYVKELEPIPNFDLLNQLDEIITNDTDLPLELKTLYAEASSRSRALTADLIIVNYLQKISKIPDEVQIYIKLWQQVRDGKDISNKDKQLLSSLLKIIGTSDLPNNVKLLFAVITNKYLENQNNQTTLQKIYQDFLESEKIRESLTFVGIKGTQLPQKSLINATVEINANISLNSVIGSLSLNITLPNITLFNLKASSITSTGLGMLDELVVVTGGAALVGAASIASLIALSEMDTQDIFNLTTATITGTIAGLGSLGLVWVGASALGIAGETTAITATTITAMITALGGLSTVTGGVSLVAFGASAVMWSFLQANKKRDSQILQYLEASTYSLGSRENNIPITDYISESLNNKIVSKSGYESYVFPQISLEKLTTAFKVFVKDCPLDIDEKVIAQINTSGYHDGGEGIIFTDKRLIWRYSNQACNQRKLEDLNIISASEISKIFKNETEQNMFAKFLLDLGKKQKLALNQ